MKCGGLGQFIGPPKLILPNLFDSSICFMRKDCDGGNGKWKKETKNCSPLLLVVARLTVTEGYCQKYTNVSQKEWESS